jgi:uncharacterized protein
MRVVRQNGAMSITPSAVGDDRATTLDWIKDHQYISLVTFKRSGDRVATPIWFAVDGQKLYAYSERDAGKMKRIRNNASIEVAVCRYNGAVLGPFVGATAKLLDSSKASYVHGLLNRKYTWKKRTVDLASKIPDLLRVRKAKPEAHSWRSN